MVHPPVKTSAEAAEVRKSPLESGAKAILVKNSKGTWLLVISAAKQIDWHLAKNIVKRTSLVPREEVPSVTGCVPGAVPPFGSLLGDHPIHTFVDTSLKEQGEYIYFNAGLRTHTVKMKYEDFVRLENPEIVHFSKSE
ncbi:hypothetical protein WA588_002441 [Blastocystis sp. NMH]